MASQHVLWPFHKPISVLLPANSISTCQASGLKLALKQLLISALQELTYKAAREKVQNFVHLHKNSPYTQCEMLGLQIETSVFNLP